MDTGNNSRRAGGLPRAAVPVASPRPRAGLSLFRISPLLLLAAALIALAVSFVHDAQSAEAQPVKPNPPENVTVTPGDGILVVSWNAPSGGPAPGTYWVDWGWEYRGVWRYARVNAYNRFTAPGQLTFTIANIPNDARALVDVKSGLPTSWSPSGPNVPADRLSEPVRVDDVYAKADGPGRKSSVATLRGMLTGLHTGEVFSFTPAFKADTTEYRAEVPEGTPWVSVRPYVTEMNATYRVEPLSEGPDRRVDLGPPGTSTDVTIVATAHDGVTTETYQLTVERGGAPVSRQESGVEFQIVEGRRSDGSGGRFVSADSQTISEGLSFNYFVKLKDRPSAVVTVAPANSSSDVWVNTGSDRPLTFTPENWSGVQLVQIFTSPGAADDEGAGSITHTISSDDSAYDGLTASFGANIVGTNSGCTPSAAPALTVKATPGSETGISMEVLPNYEVVASCGATPIVGYDTAIQKDDGAWRYSANTRWAAPSAATYSVSPVVHWYGVSGGSSYKVKLRGLTYQEGTTPWSPVAEVTVQDLGGL